MKYLLFFLIGIMIPASLRATTWDEPWMFEVISGADSFVKVDVTDNNDEEFTARITKQLAGEKAQETITVNAYHQLSFSSHSIDEDGFPFNPDLDYYLFIKKGKKPGEYSIATPTTGWAKVTESGVNATYRHSYHQALVPEDVYEMSMSAIFNKIHGVKTDEKPVLAFMNTHLNTPPALLAKASEDPAVADEFFLQHVALELFRYFGSPADMKRVEPFLVADDFHVQISAVRAIGRLKTKESQERLMKFIEGKQYGFAKIMAIWSLRDAHARQFKDRLKAFLETGEDEETGFGGNIMDPRVGTRFPSSVKSAITDLLKQWDEVPEK